MGCDIHYAVELRPQCDDCKEDVDNQDICGCVIHELVGSDWECHFVNTSKESDDPEDYKEDPSYYRYLMEQQRIWKNSKAVFAYDLEGYRDHPLYICRNYGLFSVLGDVRNYQDLIEPIGSYRGVPKDASHEFREWRRTDRDAHSTSYVTLRELIDHDCRSRGLVVYNSMRGLRKSVRQLIGGLQKLGKPDDVRLSFFFDN